MHQEQPMKTECKSKQIKFQELGSRKVVGKFDGGKITSDGGGLLLREINRRTNVIKNFSQCFTDYRDPDSIEHTVAELVSQRVFGLALGYEDLNDHDLLRSDPLLAVLCEKEDPTGTSRKCPRDKGKALAGKSTLNRLELTGLDATDDPLHGNQEGRFFHGYYRSYCYLPLYIFCEDHLLCARLRPSNIDASEGTVQELERIISRIRKTWPDVNIFIRGDSGFCREEIMGWCEAHSVGYILGLAKNNRLNKMLKEDLVDAELMYRTTGRASRIYTDFFYQTLKTWSKPRRVIGKAEYLQKGPNPRSVVTSISGEKMDTGQLYEKLYCARGDMENRIKEQQLYLFADRTSTSQMRSNQIRLYFSSVAYLLMSALRRFGLKGTKLAKAQCHTIRLKLLKVGAQVRVTVRKVWISWAEGYPFRDIFHQVFENIRKAPIPIQ